MLQIKWQQKTFDIPLKDVKTGLDVKVMLFSLCGVEPERQKILVKGGQLKDDAVVDAALAQKPLLLMGSVGKVAEVPKQTFAEDNHAGEVTQIGQLRGLTNLGNTCYMNSTVQCLASIEELRNSLDKSTKEDPLVLAMKDLFKSIHQPGNQEVVPLLFLTAMRQKYPQFAQTETAGELQRLKGVTQLYSQQDAEECFGALVTSLSMNPDTAGFVESYLTGSIKYTLTAEGQEPIVQQETFTKLQCNITSSTNYLMQSIDASLNLADPVEMRGSVWKKTGVISRAPKYLTLNMVRFFWKQGAQVKAKIMRAVKFTPIIDLFTYFENKNDEVQMIREVVNKQLRVRSDAVIEHARLIKTGRAPQQVVVDYKAAGVETWSELKPKLKEETVKQLESGNNIHGIYELHAVLTHIGRSADGGHCMAWVKKKDDWFCCDDNHVTPCSEEDVLKLNGGGDWHMSYLLCYQQVQIE